MAKAPSKVLLSGYYGFGNVGDDALLEALTGAMREAGVEDIRVPVGDPEKVPALPGVTPLKRYDFGAMARFLSDGAVLFSGGGGLFQDATSARSLLYYLAQIELARWLRRPYVVGCQSLGPLTKQWSRRAVARALRGAAGVAVRDSFSGDTAIGLGVQQELAVAGDAAFLLPPPTKEECAAVARRLPPSPRVGLCLRPTPHADALVAAIADWWQRRPPSFQFVFIACQEQDHLLHQRIAAAAGIEAPCLLPASSVRATLTAVGSCDVVIAERLHAMVFAILSGRPVAAVSYDPKVSGLAGDAGIPLVGTDADLNAVRLAAQVHRLLALGPAEGDRLRGYAADAAQRVREVLRTLFDALA